MENLAGIEQEARIAAVRKDFWVGYTTAKKIMADLEDLLKYPKKIRMPNIAVIGETNNGKSFLLSKFVDRNSPPFDPNADKTTLPIVYIRLRAKADEARLYNAILSSLFASGPDRESTDSKLDRIHRLFFHLETKMLVVDEFQHSTCGTPHKIRELLHATKNLGSDLKIPIVIGGTPEVLNSLRSDPQISNRFQPRHLERWKMSDEFLSLLATIQVKLRLRGDYDLTEEGISQRILLLGGGILGDMVDLLVCQTADAIRTGSEVITEKTLSNAYLKGLGWVPPSQRTKYAR
ncbi:TniB family NTP-binding protein [Geobacter sp. SVR]|uniref:TniB family NTP-binding protein n=1 Tax=Geobacter sp. SVR TaxID=2495594 RepID=UPI00143EFF07|nr:TniB family NTP-binding protein [Geobacter sp. SVR]BCS51775.1 transposition protein TniB [Geobacter sp. SVR]GCF87038.1 transposition protein TniB [Geobacter sp. SVR]